MIFLVTALSLAIHCPPGLSLGTDGMCRYVSPYVSLVESDGLKQRLVPSKEALSPRRIDLGRRLFFDRRLSGDGTLSCASCHQPARGTSDGLARSRGMGGTPLPRSAPALWNVAFYRRFFWDGRALTLEDQMRGPLFSPHEMASSPRHIEEVVNGSQEYRAWFSEAFDVGAADVIRVDHVIEAIADFERSLVSLGSRYDRWVFGDTHALTAREISGWNLFRSFVTRCTECHEPPLFTGQQMARIGVPDPGRDSGREAVTGDPRDAGVFRVPGLRNVSRTAPYMHAGAFGTLLEVVDFYSAGGGRAHAGAGVPAVHWHIVPMGLSRREKRDLVAFLSALDDESAIPGDPWQGARPHGEDGSD